MLIQQISLCFRDRPLLTGYWVISFPEDELKQIWRLNSFIFLVTSDSPGSSSISAMWEVNTLAVRGRNPLKNLGQEQSGWGDTRVEGQANKSAQELVDFPHMNQYSGPTVSLLNNGAKEKGGAERRWDRGRAVGHLLFRGDSHWWQGDRRRVEGSLHAEIITPHSDLWICGSSALR